MIGQELPTLHECHGMGVHLGDGFPRVFGQTADAMLDVELMLTNNSCARVAKQLVVAEQRARNGILDGSHTNDRRVTLDLLVDLLEGRTADNLYLLVLEILMGRDVVERPQFALYCYPFHIVFDAPAARFYVQQSCGSIAPAARFKGFNVLRTVQCACGAVQIIVD